MGGRSGDSKEMATKKPRIIRLGNYDALGSAKRKKNPDSSLNLDGEESIVH